MDTNENLTQNLLPVKARRKHVAMLVTACVLLAGTLIFLFQTDCCQVNWNAPFRSS